VTEPDTKEILANVIKALVDKSEEVKVTETAGNNTSVFEVDVAKEDRGKVIGKKGETAKSLRKILAGMSGKQKKRFVLEIVERD